MKRALNAIALFALALLVVIQNDGQQLLVNGYKGLALVAFSLIIGAIWNIAAGMLEGEARK